jgi:hypothetical protein
MLKTIVDWSIQYLNAEISVTTLSATLYFETDLGKPGRAPNQFRTKKISERLRRRTPSRATAQAFHSLKLKSPYANPAQDRLQRSNDSATR